MATYKVSIIVDDVQDKVLKEECARLQKDTATMVEGVAQTHVQAQIDAWIDTKLNQRRAKLSKAELLSRIDYFGVPE